MRKSTALIVTSIILPLLLAASAAANSTSNAPASFTKKDLDVAMMLSMPQRSPSAPMGSASQVPVRWPPAEL